MEGTLRTAALAAALLLTLATGSAGDGGRLRPHRATVRLDGFPIHYEVHGRGPVLMVLPNTWGLSHEGLRGLLAVLEKRFTVVYFDPRGMARSGRVQSPGDLGMATVRADFDALRRHLGLERVNVLGWSSGAANLVLLASERPDTVARAVFVHGTARFTAEDGRLLVEQHPEAARRYREFQQAMSTPTPEPAADLRVKRFLIEDYFPLLCAEPASCRPLLARAFDTARFSWRHAVHSNEESPIFDHRDRLAAITAPSLVIAGARDLLPPERARELASGIPGAQLVVLERSGHFGPIEEPRRFAAAVRDFLG